MSDVVKVCDLTGGLKYLGSQTSHLKFDFKLDTIGTYYSLYRCHSSSSGKLHAYVGCCFRFIESAVDMQMQFVVVNCIFLVALDFRKSVCGMYFFSLF